MSLIGFFPALATRAGTCEGLQNFILGHAAALCHQGITLSAHLVEGVTELVPAVIASNRRPFLVDKKPTHKA